MRQLGLRGTHSDQKVVQQPNMRVRVLPALSDNFMYLVRVYTIAVNDIH